jgi:hypothetical protein
MICMPGETATPGSAFAGAPGAASARVADDSAAKVAVSNRELRLRINDSDRCGR